MKKALAILMVLALVASAATAEITFGAWGRGLFVPVQNTGADDEDNTATNVISWGDAAKAGNIRMGMTIKGVSENAGFQIDWNSDGESFGISDQNKIWIKPVSMVTVSIGHVFDDTLRGNATFGAWDWFRAYSVCNLDGGSEDFIFKRVDTGKQGFVVSVAPMDALYFVASFNSLQTLPKTEDLLGNFQIQAGYTIANIGQIRAQYIAVLQNETAATPTYVTAADPVWVDANTDGVVDAGEVTVGYDVVDAAPGKDKEVIGTVEVAFKLTAVENLYADVSVRMQTNKDADPKGEYTDINLYANYKIDALKIHAIGRYKMLEEDDAFMMGAGVDYALANSLNIAGDIRYANKYFPGSNGSDATISYFGGITKGFSNGNIGAGFQVITAENTGYAIPVRLEYSF